MAEKKKDTELFLGGGSNLQIKPASIVTLNQTLTLVTPEDGSYQLNISIQSDFETVPQRYHEVFLNMLSAKYLNVTSFGDNPFSLCKPIPKRKWYQIWK
jgi:hypothetical protein